MRTIQVTDEEYQQLIELRKKSQAYILGLNDGIDEAIEAIKNMAWPKADKDFVLARLNTRRLP